MDHVFPWKNIELDRVFPWFHSLLLFLSCCLPRLRSPRTHAHAQPRTRATYGPRGCLQLVRFASHSPPANSITEEIANREEGGFYKAFVEHVRAAAVAAVDTGDSEGKDVFIAEEILCAEKEWYVRRELLGEGGFGRVDKVSAFTPREYFALKTQKTVSCALPGAVRWWPN